MKGVKRRTPITDIEDIEPVQGATAEVRADLSVHCPRPERDPAYQRPRGGDVRRQDRGASRSE